MADWLKKWKTERGDMMVRVTTQVTCGDYFPQRDDALRAHATQIDPNGSFFAVPLDIQQKIWPTEEFELAKTRVTTSHSGNRPVRRSRRGTLRSECSVRRGSSRHHTISCSDAQ